MPREIYEWALAAADNNFLFSDGGMPEGMARSEVNDSARERMRALRNFYNTGMEFLNLMRSPADETAFTVTRLSSTEIRVASGATDMSSFFNVGRRLRTTTAASTTDEVFVLSVVYSNPNTDVTIFSADGDSVTAGIDGVLLAAATTLGRLAYDDTVPSNFVVPSDLTDAAFAAALAVVSASGGGTVLLLQGVTLITQTHVVPPFVRILGLAPAASVLAQDVGANLDAMLDVASNNGIQLDGFSLVGEGLSQVSGDGDLIVGTDPNRLDITSMFLGGPRRHAVFLSDSPTQFRMRATHVNDCGGSGVFVDPTDDDVINCQITGVQFSGIGSGSAIMDPAAIRVAGEWAISNVSITGLDNTSGAVTQRGIWMSERAAGSAPFQDAHTSSLVGFSVSGTGQNARGIEIDGRNIAVSGGAIECTGSVSRGIVIGGPGVSELPESNVIGDVTVRGANIACLIQPPAIQNIVGSCVFRDCTTGVIVQGDRNHIHNNLIDNPTDGIVVASGANANVVRGNNIFSASGDSIRMETGETNSIVIGNLYPGGTADFSNADTATIWQDNSPIGDDEEVAFRSTAGDLTLVNTVVSEITDLTELSFPGIGANGVRKFAINATFLVEHELPGAGPENVQISLHMGPTGDSSDTRVARQRVSEPHGNATLSFSGIELVPAVGDRIGFSAVKSQTDAIVLGTIYLGGLADRYSFCSIRKVRE